MLKCCVAFGLVYRRHFSVKLLLWNIENWPWTDNKMTHLLSSCDDVILHKSSKGKLFYCFATLCECVKFVVFTERSSWKGNRMKVFFLTHLLFFLLVWVCMCMYACVRQTDKKTVGIHIRKHTCRSQRTALDIGAHLLPCLGLGLLFSQWTHQAN